MLGQPTLVAANTGSDAKSEALLPQQRVAAITGTVRHDAAFRREVRDNDARWITGPMVDGRRWTNKESIRICHDFHGTWPDIK